MKELSIEEKAKAYDERLAKARKEYSIHEANNAIGIMDTLERVFPELAESEDEKIRQLLLSFVKYDMDDNYSDDFSKEDAIAWLEKQGEQKPKFRIGDTIKKKSTGDIVTISEIDLKNREYRLSNTGFIPFKYEHLWELVEQKPADKVEPKFHGGEWITNGDYTWKIVEVKPLDYILQSQDGNIVDDTISHVDGQFHSFTIKDAKDGDVLTCYSDIKGQPIEQTGIIKQYVGRHGGCSNSFKVHFGVDWDNNVVIEGYMGSSNIYPATKEQRDTLMKSMADAGWEFDFEKKELKKIEHNTAWSEEIYRKCICAMRASACGFPEEENFVEQVDNWLKSLRPQSTWKPSDEQMKALKEAVDEHFDIDGGTLWHLYEDLKKLKE